MVLQFKHYKGDEMWLHKILDYGVHQTKCNVNLPKELCNYCKVEFNQPFCWLYSVTNLLVIQQLVTLYLGVKHVRVVCEKV